MEQEVGQGHVGERDLRRCPLDGRLCRETRKDIAGAQG